MAFTINGGESIECKSDGERGAFITVTSGTVTLTVNGNTMGSWTADTEATIKMYRGETYAVTGDGDIELYG